MSQQECRSNSDGSCDNANKDQTISFIPNEEDFPAVGAYISKKAKLSRAALAAKSKQLQANHAEISATEIAATQRSSTMTRKLINKKVLVNKWLKTVQNSNDGHVPQQTTANHPQQQQQQQIVAVRFHQQPLLQLPQPLQSTVITQQPLLQQPLLRQPLLQQPLLQQPPVQPHQYPGIFQSRQQQQQPPSPPSAYYAAREQSASGLPVRQHFVDGPTNAISMSAPMPASQYKYPHIVQYQQQQQVPPAPAYHSGGQYAASAPPVNRSFPGSSANLMIPTTEVIARRAPTPVSTSGSQHAYSHRQLGAPRNIRNNMTSVPKKNRNVPQVCQPTRSVPSSVRNSGLSHDQYTRFSNDSRIQRKMSWKNQQCVSSNQWKSSGTDITGDAFFAAECSPPSSWSCQQSQCQSPSKSQYKSQSQLQSAESQSEFQSVSQSQLEAIASCSTLNWNAKEFYPTTQKTGATDENRPKNSSMISVSLDHLQAFQAH